MTKAGQHFGYPYCHQGNFPDRQFGWGRTCNEFETPVALLGPALGRARHALLHRQACSRREYRNAIFIARHGSWNRTKKIGGDVVVVKLNTDGSVKSLAAVPDRLPAEQQLYRPARSTCR